MPQHAKSAALHILEGNPNNLTKKELYRRKKNEDSLQISAAHISPPAWLSVSAKKEFNLLKALFSETTLLTDADVNLMAVYCDTLIDYQAAVRSTQKHRTIKGRINPMLREKQKLAPLLEKLGNELGLSPSARASLAINKPEPEEDDDDEFF